MCRRDSFARQGSMPVTLTAALVALLAAVAHIAAVDASGDGPECVPPAGVAAAVLVPSEAKCVGLLALPGADCRATSERLSPLAITSAATNAATGQLAERGAAVRAGGFGLWGTPPAFGWNDETAASFVPARVDFAATAQQSGAGAITVRSDGSWLVVSFTQAAQLPPACLFDASAAAPEPQPPQSPTPAPSTTSADDASTEDAFATTAPAPSTGPATEPETDTSTEPAGTSAAAATTDPPPVSSSEATATPAPSNATEMPQPTTMATPHPPPPTPSPTPPAPAATDNGGASAAISLDDAAAAALAAFQPQRLLQGSLGPLVLLATNGSSTNGSAAALATLCTHRARIIGFLTRAASRGGDASAAMGALQCSGGARGAYFVADAAAAPGEYHLQLRYGGVVATAPVVVEVVAVAPSLPPVLFINAADLEEAAASGGPVIATTHMPLLRAAAAAEVVGEVTGGFVGQRFSAAFYPGRQTCTAAAPPPSDTAPRSVGVVLGPDGRSLVLLLPVSALLAEPGAAAAADAPGVQGESSRGCVVLWVAAEDSAAASSSSVAGVADVVVRHLRVLGAHASGPVKMQGTAGALVMPLRVRGINSISCARRLVARVAEGANDPCGPSGRTDPLLAVAVSQLSPQSNVATAHTDVSALLLLQLQVGESPHSAPPANANLSFALCLKPVGGDEPFRELRPVASHLPVGGGVSSEPRMAYPLTALRLPTRTSAEVDSGMPQPGSMLLFAGSTGSLRPIGYLPAVPTDRSSVASEALRTAASLLALDGTLAVFVPLREQSMNSWQLASDTCAAALSDHPSAGFTAVRLFNEQLQLTGREAFATSGRHALCTQVRIQSAAAAAKGVFLGVVATVLSAPAVLQGLGFPATAAPAPAGERVVFVPRLVSGAFAIPVATHPAVAASREFGAIAYKLGAQALQGIYVALVPTSQQCSAGAAAHLLASDIVAAPDPSGFPDDGSEGGGAAAAAAALGRLVFSTSSPALLEQPARVCVGTFRAEAPQAARVQELSPVDSQLRLSFIAEDAATGLLSGASLRPDCAAPIGATAAQPLLTAAIRGASLPVRTLLQHMQRAAPSALPPILLHLPASPADEASVKANSSGASGAAPAVVLAPLLLRDSGLVVCAHGAALAASFPVALPACGNATGDLAGAGSALDPARAAVAAVNIAMVSRLGNLAAAPALTFAIADPGSPLALTIADGAVARIAALRVDSAPQLVPGVTVQLFGDNDTPPEGGRETAQWHLQLRGSGALAPGVYAVSLPHTGVVRGVFVVATAGTPPLPAQLPGGGWWPVDVKLESAGGAQLLATERVNVSVTALAVDSTAERPARRWDVLLVNSAADGCANLSTSRVVAAARGVAAVGGWCTHCLAVPAAAADALALCVMPADGAALDEARPLLSDAARGRRHWPVVRPDVHTLDFLHRVPLSLVAPTDDRGLTLLVTSVRGVVRRVALLLADRGALRRDIEAACGRFIEKNSDDEYGASPLPHVVGVGTIAEAPVSSVGAVSLGSDSFLTLAADVAHTADLYINATGRPAEDFVLFTCVSADGSAQGAAYTAGEVALEPTRQPGFPTQHPPRGLVLYFARSAPLDAEAAAGAVAIDIGPARPLLQRRLAALLRPEFTIAADDIQVELLAPRTILIYITPRAAAGNQFAATTAAFVRLARLNPRSFNGSDASSNIVLPAGGIGAATEARVVLGDVEVVLLPRMESSIPRVAVGTAVGSDGLAGDGDGADDDSHDARRDGGGSPTAVITFFAIIVAAVAVVFGHVSRAKAAEESAAKQRRSASLRRPHENGGGGGGGAASPPPRIPPSSKPQGAALPGVTAAASSGLSESAAATTRGSPRHANAVDAKQLLAADSPGPHRVAAVVSCNDTTDNPLYDSDDEPPVVTVAAAPRAANTTPLAAAAAAAASPTEAVAEGAVNGSFASASDGASERSELEDFASTPPRLGTTAPALSAPSLEAAADVDPLVDDDDDDGQF